MIKTLLNNVLVLVALSISFSFLNKLVKQKLSRDIINGLVFGLLAIIAMMNTWIYGNGIIFDGRSIILGIAGLFGGLIPAIISIVIAAVYRFSMGGGGVTMGLLVISFSGIAGVLFRSLISKNKKYYSAPYIYMFGIVVHIAMILFMFTLPSQNSLI